MKKPANTEDEWFAKFEIQMIRDARRKREAILKGAEVPESTKPAGYMKCPKDGHDLKAQMLGDIEIDICDKCEGIWLDRGELEDILLSEMDKKKGLFRKLLGFK